MKGPGPTSISCSILPLLIGPCTIIDSLQPLYLAGCTLQCVVQLSSSVLVEFLTCGSDLRECLCDFIPIIINHSLYFTSPLLSCSTLFPGKHWESKYGTLSPFCCSVGYVQWFKCQTLKAFVTDWFLSQPVSRSFHFIGMVEFFILILGPWFQIIWM